MKLDSLDRSIIHLLLQDGRSSAAEVARQIGSITSRTVQYRIEKLINTGAIRVLANIKLPTIGYRARADILIDVKPGSIHQVALKLTAIDEVTYVACHFGVHDISITIHARDNEHLFSLVASSINTIAGVVNSRTMIVPVLLKYPYKWYVPVLNNGATSIISKFPETTDNQTIYKMDRTDYLITNLLMENGRLSALNIAKMLNCGSAQFVRNRIKHLMKNNVFSIDTMLVPEAFGYNTRVDIFIAAEMGQAANLAQKLVQVPAISRVACSVDNHISIQVYARHYKDVYDLLTNTVHKFPGVKKTETNLVAQLIKEFYNCQLPKNMYSMEI